MSLDIASAILFSSMLIHFALIPTLELIRRPQKNLARAHPIIVFFYVWMVQFLALMLSVTHRTTGLGSLLIKSSKNAVSAAQ